MTTKFKDGAGDRALRRKPESVRARQASVKKRAERMRAARLQRKKNIREAAVRREAEKLTEQLLDLAAAAACGYYPEPRLRLVA